MFEGRRRVPVDHQPAMSACRRSIARLACVALSVIGVMPVWTTAAQHTSPPNWTRDAVWYQIFPERFRNGDTSNDPTPRDMEGSWPREPLGEWRVSPWTSDWFELQPWEVKNGRPFDQNAAMRRYGGDLQGIIDKLDYLVRMGVTAIYLNPIFEAPSSHKYDATYFHHVDNNFGPDPDGDRRIWARETPSDPSTWKWTSADRLFLRLIAEAHKRRMRVVIDGVFNHVGYNFWAFEDVRKNGRASPYVPWFTIERFDDPATPTDEFAYVGWHGVAELPELREESDTLVDGPSEHVRAIVQRWGDPNGDGDPSDGIDGWRLDVAAEVGHGFWKRFRAWVKRINPNAYLGAEIWWDDYAANKMMNPSSWLKGDEFDGVMNYRVADATKSFFVDRRNAIAPSEFDKRLEALRADANDTSNFAMMNLMDSHDTDRVASMIVNPDRLYDHKISWKDDPTYDVRAPRPDELRRLRLVVAFQFAYLGGPSTYYGGETGMWGGDDPDDRKPMVWPELRYESERTHPLSARRPVDRVRFDASLHAYFSKLGRIRASHPALRRGAIESVLVDDSARVYAFRRFVGEDSVVAVFNASDATRTIAVKCGNGVFRDVLGRGRFRAKGGVVRLRLPALGAAYLAR
jgi:cyclomaltodextrinase / maltogenic alpha-amylase / neopullulanase